MAEEDTAKIEVFGWQNTELSTSHPHYFCISGDGKGDQGAELRPKLTGAIDAPVKSLWLPGAFGQVFVDFRWERRDMVFTVVIFDPEEDSPAGFHTVDHLWRSCWDYAHDSVVRWTYQDETMDEPDVRYVKARLLEEPKAYDSDSWEGKDPHLFNCANVVMTVACELPFYQGPDKVYTWVPEVGDFDVTVDFSSLPNGSLPASFTKVDEGGAGGVSIIDGAATWTPSGGLDGFETYLYTDDEPETDTFEVAVTIEDFSEVGLDPGSLWLIGRSDDTAENYVWCKIEYQIANLVALVRFGCVLGNGIPVPFSILPTVITDVEPSDTWIFGGTGPRTFRLKKNDVVVARDSDDLELAEVGVGFRKTGIRFQADAAFILGQHEPAPVSMFQARDMPTIEEMSMTFSVRNDGDVPVWPRWVLSESANWTLPDYSFGNEEYGRPLEDADRTVPLPFLPIGAGCVADSDPRRQTLLAANRMHLQGLWKGQDLLYPIPHGTHSITVTVANAEDGFAMKLTLPQWHTRPWGRLGL